MATDNEQQRPETLTQPVAASRVEYYIKEISEAFGWSVAWLVNVGGLLNWAKQELGHGQWISMFQRGKLKFGLRTAQMLMKIVSHPTLRNAKYFASLPPGSSILYELSKLPAETLEHEIQIGVVHPELKLKEARAIVQRTQGNGEVPQRKPVAKAFNLQRQQTRLNNYLAEQTARWPADQHLRLADLLEQVARKLRTGGDKP